MIKDRFREVIVRFFYLRKNDRIAELKRKLDDVLFKRICATGKREEFADLIDKLREGKTAGAQFERLEIPGGTDKAPDDPLVVNREFKVLDGAVVSTVSMENMSISVFKEGIGRRGTARLPELRHGVGNEKSGRFKRRMETQDEIEPSSASSSKNKRTRLDVSDAPTKNIFKAVHGEDNMERVGPSGKLVDTAREASIEDKPVVAFSNDIAPKCQDPLRELNGAPNGEDDKKISEKVRTVSKEKIIVQRDKKTTSSLKEARDRKESSRDDNLANRSRRDQKREYRSDLRPRSGERRGRSRSGDRKRPPPSASRSRTTRDRRGRERDRRHDHREKRHMRYREGDSERDGDRSRSRSRHRHRSGHGRNEVDGIRSNRQRPKDSNDAGTVQPAKTAQQEKKNDPPQTVEKKPKSNVEDSTEEGEIFDDDDDDNEEDHLEVEIENSQKVVPVDNKAEPLRSTSSSSPTRHSGRNRVHRINDSSNSSRDRRRTRESSKSELDTRSKSKNRSPETCQKSASALNRKTIKSESKESSKLISTKEVEKPAKTSSECREDKSKSAADTEVNNKQVKTTVIPSQSPPPPQPPLPSPGPVVAAVEAHSEEANDGFVHDDDGVDCKDEGEDEEVKESGPSSAVEPTSIPIPVSDLNSVDLHSMIEKKQKNLQVCHMCNGGLMIFRIFM